MVRVREINIIFLCIHLSMHPSICPSCYLLPDHRMEFNQTCYITSPHGKAVPEQHYFTVHRPLWVCLSCYLLLNHWAEFNQTCYITSPLMVRVCMSNIIFPCIHYLSVTLSPPKPLDRIQPNATSLPLMVRVCMSNIIFPCIHYLSVTLSPPKPLDRIQPNLLHHFPSW